MQNLDSRPERTISIVRAVRPLTVAFFAAALVVSAAGCGSSATEPDLVDIPPDKVPPKRANPVPPPSQHGPRYGVSPNLSAPK
jgi:hypothetical protein